MRALAAVSGVPSPVRARWRVWSSQIGVVVELELRKRLADGRSAWVLMLAALPVVLLLTLVALAPWGREVPRLAQTMEVYADIFDTLILRGMVFLGCLGIFTGLFRGEILQGSLHYYFLTPVRREVLVAGKYLAGVATAVPLFTASALASLLVVYVPFMRPSAGGADQWALVARHAGAYGAIVVLACLGYGAVFLATGLFLRNPIIPAAIILGWETANFLLPSVLKKLSIAYYLRSLRPVPVSEGPFALLTAPSPPLVAVGGVLAVAGLALAIAAIGIRRVEIEYGGD